MAAERLIGFGSSPVFGAIGTQYQASGSTVSVDVPDDVAPGDIIIVTAFIDGTATITALASGFAEAADSPVITENGGGGQHQSMHVMWKRATAADSTSGTYDFTLSGSTYANAAAARYRGALTSGDPWDVTNSATSISGSGGSPAVSDTTTIDNTLLIWASTNWIGGAWTPPSGFTERRDSGDKVCTIADLVQTTAGATGSITGSSTGTGTRTAWVGALKPVADISTLDAIVSTARNLAWNFKTSAAGKKITRAFVKLTRAAGVVATEVFNFGTPGSSDNSDGGQVYTLGLEFEASQDGYISGVEWLCSTNAPGIQVQYALWEKTGEVLKATTDLFTATPNVVNRRLFSSLVPVTAGTRYVVGVLTDRYAATATYSWPATTTHLTAPSGVNGRLATTTAGNIVYPGTISGNTATYFVTPVYDMKSTFVSGTKWQLWKRASPISTSTLVQNIEIGAGVIAGIGFTWQEVPGVSNTNLVQNDNYFTTIFMPGSDPGDYLFKSGFGNPANGSLSGNCIYHNGGTATDPPDDETFTNGAFAVDIEIDDAGGLVTGTIGQVVETGTVQQISKSKIYTLNFVTETGTVQPIGKAKATVLGQVVESGTVLPVTVVKSRTVGQVLGAETVQPISKAKSRTLNQIQETGMVESVTSGTAIVREIGQVIELSSVGRLGIKPDVDTQITIPANRTKIIL